MTATVTVPGGTVSAGSQAGTETAAPGAGRWGLWLVTFLALNGAASSLRAAIFARA